MLKTLKALILPALMMLTSVAWSAEDGSPAMPSRLQLADAFANRDLLKVQALVVDPWSGLRFFSVKDGDEAYWQAMATELRQAKLVSTGKHAVVYEIRRDGQARKIEFVLGKEGWRLDFNSFLGPFPTRMIEPE